jgi:hypothetical protein
MLGRRWRRNPREREYETKGELRCSKVLNVACAGKQAWEVKPIRESEYCQGGRRRYVRKRKDHSWELSK